jgi:apolipoprotein N-acyltransferase
VRLGEKITYAFVSNPVPLVAFLLAAFLLAAFLLAAYWNNRHLKDLDTVCEAIRITDLSGTPKNAYEKAQLICAERHWQRSQPPPGPG